MKPAANPYSVAGRFSRWRRVRPSPWLCPAPQRHLTTIFVVSFYILLPLPCAFAVGGGRGRAPSRADDLFFVYPGLSIQRSSRQRQPKPVKSSHTRTNPTAVCTSRATTSARSLVFFSPPKYNRSSPVLSTASTVPVE